MQENEQLKILEQFLNVGTNLVRNRSYIEALKYFENRLMANRLGWIYGDARSLLIPPKFTPSQLSLFITDIARYSHFDSGVSKGSQEKPTITLATIYSPDQNTPLTLVQNASLVHAEEWIHGLQHLKDGPIAGQKDSESDAAAFLLSKGIELTSDFLDRYNRRADLGLSKSSNP